MLQRATASDSVSFCRLLLGKIMTTDNKTNDLRRALLKAGATATLTGVTGLISGGVYAAGSDKPEKEEVKVGFIPLTDCASVVMASVLGFDKKYGIKIIPSKESSWASVRDKLVNGELDCAHVLYGLLYGVQMGIGGPKKDMAVLMNLNQNGQAITLSKKIADKGAVDGPSLAKLMQTDKREYSFAQTFPTGTHAMWLYYWLATHGINPMKDAKVITVPPPQMVANMRVGNMDGFCVGEPWNHRAIVDGVGITAATTQDIWQRPPGKRPWAPQAELGQEIPQHCARPDCRRARRQPLDRRRSAEQNQDGRNHRRQILRQHLGRRDQPAHPGPLPKRPGQDLG